MSMEMNKAMELLRGLVSEIERQTCEHAETHRGGAIWEICDSCGAKWADDEGGKPEFEWPESVEKAREFLAAHPTVEQAGGDERAAFEYWASDEGLYPKAVERAGNCYKLAQTQSYWMAWQARASLAQPSLMPPDRGPWHAVKWDGGRRVDLSSDDFEHDVALTVSGDFVEGDKFRYAQELAAWMNAHLAQPSPVQAEQHWPKLEKPAQVGGVRFSAGVSSRLVVEAAQRLYEFESTPDKEAERIERLQAFREQLDPLNLAPHAEAFNEAPAEALKSEQAEAERPEVVGQLVTWPTGQRYVGRVRERKGCKTEDVMTVAQHERIVGELRAEIAEWQEAAGRGRSDVVAYIAERAKLLEERDAALARIAELEKQEPVAHLRASDLERLNQPGIAGSAGSLWNGPREGFVPLYAAPVAQAQHLHDLDKQCRDDVARALGLRPSQERGFAWSYLLASIKSCVKASEDAVQAQHSVPEGWYYDAPSQVEAVIIDIRGMWDEDECPAYEDVASALRRMLAAAPGKEGNDD